MSNSGSAIYQRCWCGSSTWSLSPQLSWLWNSNSLTSLRFGVSNLSEICKFRRTVCAHWKYSIKESIPYSYHYRLIRRTIGLFQMGSVNSFLKVVGEWPGHCRPGRCPNCLRSWQAWHPAPVGVATGDSATGSCQCQGLPPRERLALLSHSWEQLEMHEAKRVEVCCMPMGVFLGIEGSQSTLSI